VPRTYDAEFRRRVVELVRAGRPVRLVAAELGLAEATAHRWSTRCWPAPLEARAAAHHGEAQRGVQAGGCGVVRR